MGALLFATALLLLLPCPVWPQAPPLPALPLESVPSAAREGLADAHRDATEGPDDADAAGTLGRLLHAWEQWDAAAQAYARAHALAPETFEWLYLEAVVLQRLARHGDAVERLRQALTVRPDDLPARVRLAEALFDAGRHDESRPLFEVLIAESPAEPAAAVGLGRIAAADGRYDEAVRHFAHAVSLFPELGAAHYGLARAYRALGRTADAERALADHARFGARWPRIEDPILAAVSALREDGRAVMQRGVTLAEQGDIEGAITAHEDALAADPGLAQAHANLVSLYGQVGRWREAEAHYHAAVAARVDLADAHYDYGVILGLQERWDLAERAYRQALETNPLHAPARNNLGQLLERRRAWDDALAEYRQAVEIQPAFRLARFNLGRMLLVRGEPREAIAEFEKLREPRDEETPRYLFGLATAHVRAGDPQRGVAIATEAKQLAEELGQTELAAVIAREIAGLQ